MSIPTQKFPRNTNPVNIYICSTVRHLLFAICRSADKTEQRHHIVYFEDSQDASLDNWNLEKLPDNISIHILRRHDIRNRLRSTIAGRFAYFCAMRKLVVPQKVRQPVVQVLQSMDPALASAVVGKAEPQLWLFNERNKMARVFRLLIPDFSNIEEGEGNYLQEPLPWYKTVTQTLKGMEARYRVLGDHRHCEEIWVIHPEKLPLLVRAKGRQIDFLDSPEIIDTLKAIFGDISMAENSPDTVILATEPLDALQGMQTTDKQQIYKQILTYLQNQGARVILKAHPREKIGDYQLLSADAIIAHSKIPVEALILGSAAPRLLITVMSTSGLGFEKFCERIKLCGGSYQESVANIKRWATYPDELDQVLNAKLAARLHA